MKKTFCDLCGRHISMFDKDKPVSFYFGTSQNSSEYPLELCKGCSRVLTNTIITKMDEIRKENKNEYSSYEKRDLDSLSSLDTGQSNAGEPDCGDLPFTSIEWSI